MRTLLLIVSVSLGLGVLLAEPPADGSILVTKNRLLVEGAIRKVGEEYQIRRPTGTTMLPADQVWFVCDSLPEAYAGLLERADAGDPNARLDLCRWCLTHGLRREALAEASAALELRPEDPEAARLAAAIAESLERPPIEAAPVTEEESEPAIALAEPAAYNPESYPLFATKVQPILMNTCANCHAGNSGGDFRLIRLLPGERPRRDTVRNISSAIRQIDRENVAESPLLLYAVAAHGDAQSAPIQDRSHPAYRTLENWVRRAVLDEAELKAAEAELGEAASPIAGVPVGQPSLQPPKVETVDPFDPAGFNSGPGK